KTTVPALVQRVLVDQLGLEATVLIGAGKDGIIPGFAEAVKQADLVLLSMRRRAVPPQDLAALRAHLDGGKPLLALRTSSHAFDAKGKPSAGLVEWSDFDPIVLGGNYHNHHPVGPTTTVQAVPAAEKHPILVGVTTPFSSQGSLYKTSPLRPSATPLLR